MPDTGGHGHERAPPGPGADDWRALVGILEVAHHIPGRIRLRVTGMPLPGGAAGRARTWLDLVRALPGVVSVKVNVLARSGTVAYDPTVIAPQTWSDLLGGRATAGTAVLVRQLALHRDDGRTDGGDAR